MPESEAPRPVPYWGRFQYSRGEVVADALVHAVALVLAAAGGAALLIAAAEARGGVYAAAVLYVVSLLAVFSISLAYNAWPLSPAKWVLRRLDHAAIYLLIAATYTPFLAQLENPLLSRAMLAVVWAAALGGIALKLALPGRLDRLAVAFYLAIGWSGALIARPLLGTLAPSTLALLVAGGLVYSCGVVFYAWQKLRFHNVLWHAFVLVGAALHFAAVADTVVWRPA